MDASHINTKFFDPSYLFNQEVGFFHNIFSVLSENSSSISAFYHFFLIFLTIFFITMICYCSVRMFEIRKKEKNHLHHEMEEYAHHEAEKERKAQQTDAVSSNPRWIKTLSYLFSQHASDWKLAVIEADSILEDLLNQLGFRGESLGDKLKSADQEKFRNLTSAWEVHTIRNKIAHEGASFELSQHEAKRVIAIYEQIFRSYGFV